MAEPEYTRDDAMRDVKYLVERQVQGPHGAKERLTDYLAALLTRAETAERAARDQSPTSEKLADELSADHECRIRAMRKLARKLADKNIIAPDGMHHTAAYWIEWATTEEVES